MKNIVILGDRDKQNVSASADRICEWLEGRADVTVNLEMAMPDSSEPFDVAIVLGGDGAVLRTARQVAEQQIPLLGLNLGKFGFLTESTAAEFEAVLTDVIEGRYTVSERMMLQCELQRGGKAILDTIGLNDAVISRTALSRLITIDVHVNGDIVNTYRADGLIVATPAGSTAHSLAAGGPILYPDLEAFVLAPICPHTLSNRPLVLPGDCRITMSVTQSPERPSLTVDGQVNSTLHHNDVVAIRKADEPLRLICTGRNTFFDTLRNKLDWRGQPRYVR